MTKRRGVYLTFLFLVHSQSVSFNIEFLREETILQNTLEEEFTTHLWKV